MGEPSRSGSAPRVEHDGSTRRYEWSAISILLVRCIEVQGVTIRFVAFAAAIALNAGRAT